MLIVFFIAAGLTLVYLMSQSDSGSSDSTGLGAALTSVLGSVTSTGPVAPFAQNAGFEGNDLVTAIAVAYAESGGIASKYNPETAAKGGTPAGMGSYGLWQIYMKAHPEFSGWNLYDPQTNANAAYSVYMAAGMTFRPWSTYGGGQYLAFVDKAQSEADAVTA